MWIAGIKPFRRTRHCTSDPLVDTPPPFVGLGLAGMPQNMYFSAGPLKFSLALAHSQVLTASMSERIIEFVAALSTFNCRIQAGTGFFNLANPPLQLRDSCRSSWVSRLGDAVSYLALQNEGYPIIAIGDGLFAVQPEPDYIALNIHSQLVVAEGKGGYQSAESDFWRERVIKHGFERQIRAHWPAAQLIGGAHPVLRGFSAGTLLNADGLFGDGLRILSVSTDIRNAVPPVPPILQEEIFSRHYSRWFALMGVIDVAERLLDFERRLRNRLFRIFCIHGQNFAFLQQRSLEYDLTNFFANDVGLQDPVSYSIGGRRVCIGIDLRILQGAYAGSRTLVVSAINCLNGVEGHTTTEDEIFLSPDGAIALYEDFLGSFIDEGEIALG